MTIEPGKDSSVGELGREPTAAPPLGAVRRRKIKELLDVRGDVRVTELSELLGVSEVTIRYDLQKLAEQGVLLRDRGGAIAQRNAFTATRFEERSHQQHNAKVQIARAAASLVESGQTVIFDAGTTVEEFVRQLPPNIRLTIVTTAWNIGLLAATSRDARVILVGGSLSRQTLSTIGPITENELDDILVDQVFLGAHALLSDYGVVDRSIEIARTKRGMIRAAGRVVVLADASKWGRSAMAKVAPWSRINTLVTDAAPPQAAETELRRAGTRLILAVASPETAAPTP